MLGDFLANLSKKKKKKSKNEKFKNALFVPFALFTTKVMFPLSKLVIAAGNCCVYVCICAENSRAYKCVQYVRNISEQMQQFALFASLFSFLFTFFPFFTLEF